MAMRMRTRDGTAAIFAHDNLLLFYKVKDYTKKVAKNN
jgi:uncharacterized C2H2 Zn-finger protein